MSKPLLFPRMSAVELFAKLTLLFLATAVIIEMAMILARPTCQALEPDPAMQSHECEQEDPEIDLPKPRFKPGVVR